MTHAVAIGYDWLYSLLSDEEKDTIESGTLSKGLEVCGVRALPVCLVLALQGGSGPTLGILLFSFEGA